MNCDARIKRALFIDKSTGIREMFAFASPVEVLSAVRVYACDFYGAMLWDLYGETASMVYKAWNTCIKLAWNVPRATHTYFLDHLLGVGFCHTRVDLLTRYTKFFARLLKSASSEVRILANAVGRDVRSTTGKNLWNLGVETGLDIWSVAPGLVKTKLMEKTVDIPVRDTWRPCFLGKLLVERGEKIYCGEDVTELDELIDSLCTG